MKAARLPSAVIVLVVLGHTAALGACSSDGKPANTPADKPKSESGSAVETYFPLEEGKMYSYETNEGGEKGMLVARVHRTDPLHGELRLSNATKRFVYSTEGVAYDTGAFILKAPVTVGT